MWPSSRRLALRGRNLTRDNQADGVPMVHQASGGESCQRSFFSRHRTPEPCLKKSILVSCTVQKSEKPTKTRSNRTFRVDYHPHALQKSPLSLRNPRLRLGRATVESAEKSRPGA